MSIRFEKYQPGDFIVKAGDECKQLVFLLNGSVSLEIVDKSKKFAISEKLSKQMALFPANLFGRQTQYPASVVAIDEVSTMSISKVQTMSLMKSDDVFLLNFLNIVSIRYQQTVDIV
ncbi:MAG: cyclic nucleotide-binding domain-containing protein, partial [Bacteroidales bacterium]|nr:cyclic nucleotide-binding domain-containing protein [Bacteroidales bacterium]